jgi:trimeric autotransporter adhesin
MTDKRAAHSVVLIMLPIVCTSCEDFWHVPIASITVTPPALSLLTGFKQQFTASVTYVDGSRAVLKSPVWTTSNAAILFTNNSGMATAVAPSSATISASADGVSGSTTVTITSSPLTSIEISPSNPSITVAQGSQQFSATGLVSDGTVTDITNGVSWSSSDVSIATINKTGLASAVGKARSTTIQATSGNIVASTTLTVTR